MRISDWTADVCSSVLDPPGPAALARAARELAEGPATLVVGALSPPDPAPAVDVVRPPPGDPGQGRAAGDPAPRARRRRRPRALHRARAEGRLTDGPALRVAGPGRKSVE